MPDDLLKTLTDAVGHFTEACCLTGGCCCPPANVFPVIGMEPREPCGGTRCTCGAEHTARKLLPVVEALIEAGVQPLREALLEVQAVQRELNDSGNPILQSAAGRLNGIGAHLWTPEELAALETDR